MLIFIPIQRVHIEHSVVLKNITVSSNIALNESNNILINNKEYSTSLLNKSSVLDLFNESFAIYHIDELDVYGDQIQLVEQLIKPVDYALDSLRVSLNSFTFHEQVIGTAGFYEGNKVAVVLSENFESYKIIKGKELYYELSEGIGCDATGFYTDENDILLSFREDEVYVKYRNVLHRLFKAIQIYDINTCFAYLFSTIDGLDCIPSDNFQDKKIRILSFIVKNQNEFDILSQQFYFYSQTVRTEIIHAGKSLYDIIPWKEMYNLLDNLYLLVVRFCMASLKSGITTFSELDEKICEKCNEFLYSCPNSDMPISEMPVTTLGKCDYFAEVNNLNITTCLKIGETLFLPANSKENVKKFYEMYQHGVGLCMISGLDEKELKVDSNFPNYNLLSKFNLEEKSFTVWDVDLILTALSRNISIDGAFAIIENQPYWESLTYGFNYSFYCEFSDIICNTIQKALNYLILSNEIKKDTILPSKVGINDAGIRVAYINPEDSSSIYALPGRVYGEYIEPHIPFVPYLTDCSETLYNCFFGSRSDEVFSINRNALNRIAESTYFQDASQTLLTIFDAMDMLYPTTYDGGKLIKRIATFCCNTQTEKIMLVNYLKDLRRNLRNPLLHGGKSIIDFELNEDDAYKIINRIKSIVIKYCENTYMLDIHTFQALQEEQKSKSKFLLTHFK